VYDAVGSTEYRGFSAILHPERGLQRIAHMSISHAILGVLVDGDRHGYELARMLAERVGGEPYNTGQIHQALEQLERAGWAASRTTVEAARSRRQFRITSEGRKEFSSWLARPVAPLRPVRDDMLLKLVLLAERDRAAALRLLEARKRELLNQLSEHLSASAPARYAALTLMALRFRIEADLRWVDHCIAVLRPPMPAPGAEEAEEPPPPLAALPPAAQLRQY
jgi:DNA-binding PadR family transcriptional regulator